MKRFLATNNSGVLLFQRVVLGLVMLPHGMQKLFGWWGGFGWDATLGRTLHEQGYRLAAHGGVRAEHKFA